MHAIVAHATCHRLSLKNKRAKLSDFLKEGGDLEGAALQALSHYWEAVRLMQKRFESAKDALSNVSIFIVCALTACTVKPCLYFKR